MHVLGPVGVSVSNRTALNHPGGTALPQRPAGTAGQPPPEAPNTDVAASRKRTRGALLAGLRSGRLEQAVAKMEDDEVKATATKLPVKATPAAEQAAFNRMVKRPADAPIPSCTSCSVRSNCGDSWEHRGSFCRT